MLLPSVRQAASSDFTLDRVKFRVICRGCLEIGLESDTQVRLLAIYKTKYQVFQTKSAGSSKS